MLEWRILNDYRLFVQVSGSSCNFVLDCLMIKSIVGSLGRNWDRRLVIELINRLFLDVCLMLEKIFQLRFFSSEWSMVIKDVIVQSQKTVKLW